ncbi:acyl-CoA dehydrogenase [Cupriavidus necator]|uniref:acyl-CoA dehydrogenase family protein n=1 Tax=Cupriavidus necator TaxID=106590 RepID=UPI000735C5F4|nr:acyl-CoA dehydrogenase family protein [Cupriavidus necator]KUE86343.1 acyl-CoA dehydrogenase [Cupriavidus necator]
MDFTLNSEQQLLQDSVRRYVDKAYDFETRASYIQASRAGRDTVADNWKVFAENGWLMAALPEVHGGLGGSLTDTALIAQELGRGLVLEPYIGCAVLAAQTLVAGGTAEQKASLVPQLAEGSRRIALAYSEPDSRGMPEVVATRADKDADGYVIHGRKSLVLGAVGADAFIVSAQVTGEADIALLLVDAGSAGLARQPMPLHDATWVEDLTFDGVRVPAGNRLEGGLSALRTGLAHGTVALCAGLVGAMEKAITLTAEYLKTRQQFGVPIGTFQALQHRMADMAAEMELARSMLHALLASVENDSEAARQRTLSATKSLVCRAAKYVCGQGVQLHGGIGMTEEYAVGHYFKHAIVADLLLGSSDRHDAACAAALQAELGH